jgi:uncharacterized oxidoreductase
MNLTGNTILITGGNGGIGRGLAEAFLKLGNTVVITGRSQAKLDETLADNPGLRGLPLDVADADDIAAFAKRIADDVPALNVLINNAGIMENEDVTAGSVDVAERTIATNLLGPIRLTTALLPQLLKQPRATVMTVTSGLAFVPIFPNATYCATKAAIHSYSQTLRRQLAKTNVEVIELIPPYVQTHLMGAHQANDLNAMPLADFIAEAISILKANPSGPEIAVERVKFQRNAERENRYDAAFEKLNDYAAQRLIQRGQAK